LPMRGNGSTGTSAHEIQAYQPSASFADRDRLGRPLKRAMESNGDPANCRQAEHATIQHRAVAILGIGEGVVAGLALEARVLRCLPVRDALEERLIRPLDPPEDILHDVGMHLTLPLPEGKGARDRRGSRLAGGAARLPDRRDATAVSPPTPTGTVAHLCRRRRSRHAARRGPARRGTRSAYSRQATFRSGNSAFCW
jgi:hypothetical protein